MFDIGFWELSIIAVVALLVVGPERLPGMARTVGLYAGKLRRWVTQVRGEVERELRAEEIRQAMRDAQRSETARSVTDALKVDEMKDAFRSAGSALKDAAAGDTDAGGATPKTSGTSSSPPGTTGRATPASSSGTDAGGATPKTSGTSSSPPGTGRATPASSSGTDVTGTDRVTPASPPATPAASTAADAGQGSATGNERERGTG